MNRYRELRIKMGKTQGEMADLVGVGQRSWCGYEQGTSEPRPAIMQKIAKMEEESGIIAKSADVPTRSELPQSEEAKEYYYRLKEARLVRREFMEHIEETLRRADTTLRGLEVGPLKQPGLLDRLKDENTVGREQRKGVVSAKRARPHEAL